MFAPGIYPPAAQPAHGRKMERLLLPEIQEYLFGWFAFLPKVWLKAGAVCARAHAIAPVFSAWSVPFLESSKDRLLSLGSCMDRAACGLAGPSGLCSSKILAFTQ